MSRFLLSTALATLKPQAGLVAPQAVPASQPAAAVSSWALVSADKTTIRLSHHAFKKYLILPFFLHQGAGGEPMEISEQVGMTPEIIQKVILIYFF